MTNGNMLKQEIIKVIKKNVPEMGEFELTFSENKNFGHFSTNTPFKLVKELNKNPFELAQEIADKISKEDIFEKVEAAEPGFINFFIKTEYIQKQFEEIYRAKGNWGSLRQTQDIKSAKTKDNRSIVIDYSGPNIAKPMGIGHLRSTIIGQALTNIFRFSGNKVIGDNHLGDWGKQFGMLIAGYKTIEREGAPISPLKIIAAQKNNATIKFKNKFTVDDLLNLYVSYNSLIKDNPELENIAREEVKKLQQGDKENIAIWKKFYKVSIDEFNRMYQLLGVKFDHQLGESFYNKMLPSVVKDALDKNVAIKSEGAIVMPIEGHQTPMIIQKSDGAYLYTTTDLATIKYRNQKFKPKEIIYVVANEQTFHFEQLFKSAYKLGYSKDEKLVHVKFGLILASDAKKFSTRAGKTVPLMDVINEAIEKAKIIVNEKQRDISKKEVEKIAQLVGIGAIKYNDLSQNRLSDITFNWDKMLNLEGNSAPYLMYTYARMKSILRKAPVAFFGRKFSAKDLKEESELQLMLRLDQFPDVIERVTENYFPHYLSDYLYILAKEANAYYQKVSVLKSEKEKNARLALVLAVSRTLKTGLNLLGIETLEKM